MLFCYFSVGEIILSPRIPFWSGVSRLKSIRFLFAGFVLFAVLRTTWVAGEQPVCKANLLSALLCVDLLSYLVLLFLCLCYLSNHYYDLLGHTLLHTQAQLLDAVFSLEITLLEAQPCSPFGGCRCPTLVQASWDVSLLLTHSVFRQASVCLISSTFPSVCWLLCKREKGFFSWWNRIKRIKLVFAY